MSQTIDLSKVTPDFVNFVSALQKNLKVRDSWTDIYTEATGETLLEFAAAFGTLDQWSIERSFKEAFLGTATADTSIYAGTRMLGVRITRKLPGIQTANFKRSNTLNLPTSDSLIIPKFSQMYCNTNIPFFNRTPINFKNYSINANGINIYQGQVYTKQYISDGTPFQQIIIPSTKAMAISDVDIIVTVDDVEWTIIYDGLWHYTFSDYVVADATLGNGDVILQFGNGNHGVIPPLNSVIKITYVETQGASQGLIATGSEIALATQINGYSISGSIIKSTSSTLISTTIANLDITLSSITNSNPTASLPSGNSWDISHVGMQLEGENGLALISGVATNVANLLVINPFSSTTLVSGAWSLSIPSTGTDEKDPKYYSILAPALSRASNRAVTPADISVTILSYPGISDVLIRTEKDLIQTVTIAKSAATIAAEKAANVYDGTTTYQITEKPNVALYNVVWVSFITSNGISFTAQQNETFLTWLEKRIFVGAELKLQTPTKDYVNLQLDVYCVTTQDKTSVQTSVENIIRDMFSTTQPMLSKKITLSDIIRKINSKLLDSIDYVEVFKLVEIDSVYVPQAFTEVSPTNASIDTTTGFPIPPGYLCLNTLIINTYTTGR